MSVRLFAGLALAFTAQVSAVTYPLPELEWTAITNTEIDPTNQFRSGCATGDKYTFAVKRGTVNKLVIEFEGGGLCYDSNTCFPAFVGNSVTCTTLDLEGTTGLEGLNRPDSITDVSADSTNYFKDWNHVYIRYCTCDLNTGDAVQELTDFGDCTFFTFGCKQRNINFRGGRNTDMVFTWLKTNYLEAFGQASEPEKVLTAGVSAGGYSSIAFADKVNTLLPDSKHYLMSDSAAGSAFDPTIINAFRSWDSVKGIRDQGVGALLSNIINDPATNAPDGVVVALTTNAADLNPAMKFTKFNTANDQIQNGFRCITERNNLLRCISEFTGSALMPTFQSDMRSNAVATQTDRCNVRWFFTSGDYHGTLQGPDDDPAQSWFNIDVGQGKNLHDILVDVVEDECVESSSSVPFFAASSNVNSYCGASATCNSVAQRAADAGVNVDVFKDMERLAANENDTASESTGLDPIVAAVLAGVGSGVVAAVASTIVVVRMMGNRQQQARGDVVVNPIHSSQASGGGFLKGEHIEL